MSSPVPELVNKARVHYARERAKMNASFGELDTELVEILRSTAVNDTQAAHEAMGQALDLAYDLTGDCDALEELSDAIGFAWEDE